MAITTLGELKAAAVSWSDRGDLGDALLEELLETVWERMDTDLRHWRMTQRARATVGAGDDALILPDDWLEARAAHIRTTPIQILHPMTPEDLFRYKASNSASGVPCRMAVTAQEILLHPTPSDDTEVELLYYERIPRPASDADSNWVIDHHATVALSGLLAEVYRYIFEEDRAQLHQQRFEDGLARMNRETQRAAAFQRQAVLGGRFD